MHFMWFGNPKSFLIMYCFGLDGVHRMFCSGAILAPYWSRNVASFTKSEQSTTGWGQGGVFNWYVCIFPMIGTKVVPLYSCLVCLLVGGGWRLFVSLARPCPASPCQDIEEGDPCYACCPLQLPMLRIPLTYLLQNLHINRPQCPPVTNN